MGGLYCFDRRYLSQTVGLSPPGIGKMRYSANVSLMKDP